MSKFILTGYIDRALTEAEYDKLGSDAIWVINQYQDWQFFKDCQSFHHPPCITTQNSIVGVIQMVKITHLTILDIVIFINFCTFEALAGVPHLFSYMNWSRGFSRNAIKLSQMTALESKASDLGTPSHFDQSRPKLKLWTPTP